MPRSFVVKLCRSVSLAAQYAALEKKRISNWQRRAEEKRRAEEEERRAELERMQKNAHLEAVRERNIEGIVQRRSSQEEELLKKEKERQLIKEVNGPFILSPRLSRPRMFPSRFVLPNFCSILYQARERRILERERQRREEQEARRKEEADKMQQEILRKREENVRLRDERIAKAREEERRREERLIAEARKRRLESRQKEGSMNASIDSPSGN